MFSLTSFQSKKASNTRPKVTNTLTGVRLFAHNPGRWVVSSPSGLSCVTAARSEAPAAESVSIVQQHLSPLNSLGRGIT